MSTLDASRIAEPGAVSLQGTVMSNAWVAACLNCVQVCILGITGVNLVEGKLLIHWVWTKQRNETGMQTSRKFQIGFIFLGLLSADSTAFSFLFFRSLSSSGRLVVRMDTITTPMLAVTFTSLDMFRV